MLNELYKDFILENYAEEALTLSEEDVKMYDEATEEEYELAESLAELSLESDDSDEESLINEVTDPKRLEQKAILQKAQKENPMHAAAAKAPKGSLERISKKAQAAALYKYDPESKRYILRDKPGDVGKLKQSLQKRQRAYMSGIGKLRAAKATARRVAIKQKERK